jgi:hypothetical protein
VPKGRLRPKRCLKCFDILSWYMLDNHDLDGVYGTDEEIEVDLDQATFYRPDFRRVAPVAGATP